MKEYNGHRSWNAWNVSLWIENDESIYLSAMAHINERKLKGYNAEKTIRLVTRALRKELPFSTPDGAKYNQISVKLTVKGLME